MPKEALSTSPVDEKVETVQTVETKSDDTTTAPSSGGADEAPPRQSLLDVVRNAAQPKKVDDDEGAPSGSETKDEAAPAETGVKTGEVVTAAVVDPDAKYDDPKLPFHKHHRWQELRGDLKAAREQAAGVKSRLESIEPLATRQQSITDFMQKNQLEPDHMVQLFRMGALIRNDPEKAIAELRQLVAELQDDVGERLPTDLKDAVDNGEMTESRALELSKARAQAKRATETANSVKEVVTTQNTEKAQRELMTDLGGAAIKWETAKKSADPDFALKIEHVREHVRNRSKASPPKSVAEGVTYLEDAYKSVNALFAKARPSPKAITDTTRRSSAATVQQDTAAPKSLREAISRGLAVSAKT